MQQVLHVLVVDRAGEAALVRRCAARWLLPIVSCAENTRAASAMLAWMQGRGLTGQLVGQWLGRVTQTADSIDWLIVIRASAGHRPNTAADSPSWTPLTHLRSSPAISDYQQWALHEATRTAQAPTVRGPFGAITWVDRVMAWIEEIASAPPAGLCTVYRASAHEVVLGVPLDSGVLYFKGLSCERAFEAHLTSALSAAVPDAFAQTAALSQRADGSLWWLAEECAGKPLSATLTIDRVRMVGAALARIQNEVAGLARIEADCPRLDLAAAARWGVAALRNCGRLADVGRCCASISDAFDDVSDAAVLRSWTPLDLDPANVLLDADGTVRFIDLDRSFLAPAPLAVATLARRVRRWSRARLGCDDPSPSLYRAYDGNSGSQPLTERERRAFELSTCVLEVYLGSQRVAANAARGELHGPLDLIAPLVGRRLVRAVNAHSIF